MQHAQVKAYVVCDQCQDNISYDIRFFDYGSHEDLDYIMSDAPNEAGELVQMYNGRQLCQVCYDDATDEPARSSHIVRLEF